MLTLEAHALKVLSSFKLEGTFFERSFKEVFWTTFNENTNSALALFNGNWLLEVNFEEATDPSGVKYPEIVNFNCT